MADQPKKCTVSREKNKLSAMAFVVVARVVIFMTAGALIYPLNWIGRWLPSTDGPAFPRLSKIQNWFNSTISARTPDWVEYKGNGVVLLKTEYGKERLDCIVERIPESVRVYWHRFGVALMKLFVVIWAGVLLFWVAASIRVIGQTTITTAKWAIQFDWLSLLDGRPAPRTDWSALVSTALDIIQAAPEIGYALSLLLGALVIAIAVVWIIMLPLLPGLILHEFGHYAAIRKAGGTVDEYGLLLFGPILGGAFVEPGEDVENFDATDSFAVWSGGIANSMLWGLSLLTVATILGADIPSLVYIIQPGGLGMVVQWDIPVVVALLGFLEIGNAFLNAIPIGAVDGGGFIREVEEERFGYVKSLKHPLLSGGK